MSLKAVAKPAMSEAEWTMRCELAACYRLMAMYGWDELIGGHLSARLPEEDAYLLNPFGLMFDEVTASNLVKFNSKGEVLSGEHDYNPAGFVIHYGILKARPDVNCVMHLHTIDGVAVSSAEPGLLPLNQTAMLVADDLAFHEFEGIALDDSEQERLEAHLGSKNLMLLRNHGTLGVGPTIADCFVRMFYLEWSCTAQIRALGMGLPMYPASAESIESVANLRKSNALQRLTDLSWSALYRKAQRQSPGFDR